MTSTITPRSLSARLRNPSYVELVFVLVFVWGFGDTVSTVVAAEFAGVHLEANPWIRLLLAHEPLLVVLLKGAVGLLVGVILLECRTIVERVPWWRTWMAAVVGLGIGVVVVNVLVTLQSVGLLV